MLWGFCDFNSSAVWIEVVNKEKQQFNEQNWKMGEKNWSFSVVADKSSLLWSVIWAIFPFRVGTEIRFAEISFEPQCAGQAVLSHSAKLFHPTSIKAPSNPLDSLTHQANWGSSRPGLCFRTKPMKLLIYSCSEHAPTALGTVWSLFPREPPWCWAHPLLSWAAGGFGDYWGFFPPLWGFFWRHQSKIICCTWLTLISIYKYVIPPRSRGDDLNLLQEGGGRGKLIYFYLGWDCCSLGGNEDVTQLWSLRWCFHFDNLEA